MNLSTPEPTAAAENNQVAARRAGEDAGDPGPGGKGGVAPDERLLSLDAYRGAIMLLMASSGLGLAEIARNHFPGDPVWAFIGKQTDHAPWAGCTLWDIIQPAFMFMVGVAVPWSVANRRARGASFNKMLVHALWRSLALVLLGVFLTSAWSDRTQWSFNIVLAQIGLGYPFLFLLAFAKPRYQWTAAFVILFLYWLAFAVFPLPGPNFEWASAGINDAWPRLSGFAAHWEKNANFATWFDQWFLNLFPREKPFQFSSGGYHTLNFVPSLATMTMIFGLLVGQWLRGDLPLKDKVKRFELTGIAGVLLGGAIALAGLCPIVKRIWTPSWALFSGGIVTLLLALFVRVVDWRGWKKWTFPLVVVGLNPITLYCIWQVMGPFVRQNLKNPPRPTHFRGFWCYLQSNPRTSFRPAGLLAHPALDAPEENLSTHLTFLALALNHFRLTPA
jgi:heparan-alpha-glucosaminide N-acetyltransferase